MVIQTYLLTETKGKKQELGACTGLVKKEGLLQSTWLQQHYPIPTYVTENLLPQSIQFPVMGVGPELQTAD